MLYRAIFLSVLVDLFNTLRFFITSVPLKTLVDAGRSIEVVVKRVWQGPSPAYLVCNLPGSSQLPGRL
jgi:hypothetical protein